VEGGISRHWVLSLPVLPLAMYYHFSYIEHFRRERGKLDRVRWRVYTYGRNFAAQATRTTMHVVQVNRSEMHGQIPPGKDVAQS
jgi:hypothetical protein